MTKVCDFSKGISNKINDAAVLHIENECLRQKVSEVAGEITELKEVHIGQSQQIVALRASLNEIKTSYSQALAQHTEHVDSKVERQSAIFADTINLYENWTTYIGVLIALAGVTALCFIGYYKKRQVEEIVDKAKASIDEHLKDNNLLISAVVNAFDHERVEGKMNSFKSEMLYRQESLVRTMISDRIESSESADFRSTFQEDGNESQGE